MSGATKYSHDYPNRFDRDFLWADKIEPQLKDIILSCCSGRVRFERATPNEDMRECTDAWAVVEPQRIAIRVRRPRVDRYMRDLTLRSFRSSGALTELQKLRRGDGDLYLYAWANADDTLGDWVVADLHLMRRCGLLYEKLPEMKNKDGKTGFVFIELCELSRRGCVREMSQSLRGRMRQRYISARKAGKRCYCYSGRCTDDRS